MFFKLQPKVKGSDFLCQSLLPRNYETLAFDNFDVIRQIIKFQLRNID
jgi:hypothetical protein